MVGRQLEKFKREKKKINEKIKAMRIGANSNDTSKTLNEDHKDPRPLIRRKTTSIPMQQKKDDDWSKDVRNELSSILEGIPADRGRYFAKKPKNAQGGINSAQ